MNDRISSRKRSQPGKSSWESAFNKPADIRSPYPGNQYPAPGRLCPAEVGQPRKCTQAEARSGWSCSHRSSLAPV